MSPSFDELLEIWSLEAIVDKLQNAGSGLGLALPEAQNALGIDLRLRRHVISVDLGLARLFSLGFRLVSIDFLFIFYSFRMTFDAFEAPEERR